MTNQPTVFHLTHHKAGSQWVAEILKRCAPERFVLPQIQVAHFLTNPIKIGGIYPTVYVSRAKFETTLGLRKWSDRQTHRYFFRHPVTFMFNWLHFRLQKRPYRKFIVIRDLRDTLISLYFSLKISHPQITSRHVTLRQSLNALDQERGLMLLMDQIIPGVADKQLSWLHTPDTLFLKYEHLLADEYTTFQHIIAYCQIQIHHQTLSDIIKYNSFESVTGRKRGDEDITLHQRKGIAGDWRNYFSERIKEEFKRRFGNVLIQTGYERDDNW
ncbi:sulfotransferase [Candidatus Vecturithrix granuli]|uniref:Sulfotransferase n=1 Tax=Vecturithrix granuli TaxID=1499967 RepID=A0A081BTV3_VECG1|nr:sulfotransferase [Candidatus Vecturithrix granuli]